ncbi:hypothetical protein CC80DRAFT_487362 [Byssothecium circinans]|uniref:N-acetyltransferase domain-containing protein n=1 Tax=Byssothecium circinans TaxID=147558 RepID=A0A6A5UPD0_9PLEO|nr:hypothetical protein CC80DRAFT_487362 [Byssothecium circinans]
MSTIVSSIEYRRDWEAVKQLIASSPGSTSEKLAAVEREYNNNANCYILKAVNTTTDRVVGVSVWFLHTSQRQPGCWTGPTTQPHIYLYLVSTQTSNEAAPYAQSLMQWGIDRADSLGLEIWTYASSSDTNLYESNAFIKVEEILTEYQSVWSLRRMAIDNRRVHKEAYLSTCGFW